MSDRFWTVAGFEGENKVFERSLSVNDVAESEVKSLLQHLAARGLSEEEIVDAHAGSGGALAIERLDGDTFGFSTPSAAGRYYVATLGETE